MNRTAWCSGMMFVAACTALAACGDDEEPAPGGYGALCDLELTCETGLQCINRLCTGPCSTTTDCAVHSNRSECVGGNVGPMSTGFCYDTCIDSVECRGGLICTMLGTTQGTCRPAN